MDFNKTTIIIEFNEKCQIDDTFHFFGVIDCYLPSDGLSNFSIYEFTVSVYGSIMFCEASFNDYSWSTRESHWPQAPTSPFRSPWVSRALQR